LIIKKITLLNFRNYEKENINFDNKINIIIGDNAQGKTNILESIYFLALTKSYRTNDSNLIRINSDFSKVKGEIKDNKISKNLEVFITNDNKEVKINSNKVNKISDYITNMNVILVSPEDINILQGSPADRRNFLNIELSQISKIYLNKYNEFNKLLKIRNNYLKLMYSNFNKDTRYLDSITENLIEREIDIYIERNNFIKDINERAENIFKDITGLENFKIIYKTNIDINDFDRDNLRQILENKYKSSYDKEIEQGMTLYGPHRDDLEFYIGDEDIKLFGSQGQQKLAIIAIKLSEIEIFNKITNTYPILLLDDIFSYLDVKNRNKLIKYIDDGIQVIITSNDTKGIAKNFIDNAKIFKVTNGNIKEKVITR
jgi:DNA replication and repair protein RecF